MKFFLNQFYSYIVIIATIIVVFNNSLDCDFTFDDISAIVQNRYVHFNETDWYRLFDVDYWGTPIHSEHSHKSYRPLTSLTFRLNHLLSSSLNPYGFHLINIILHIIVSLIYYQFLQTILSSTVTKNNQWTSTIFTLYFAIHPVKCEAVTSIVGRAELLSTLFIMISLFFYLKSSYIMFTISVFLASFSKEQGMTTPLICIAIECLKLLIQFKSLNHLSLWIRLKRSFIWNKTIVKIFVLILYTLLLITIRIYLTGLSLPVFTRFDNPASFEETPIRQLTYNYLLPLNVRLMLWPKWLCADWTMNSIPLVKTFDDPRNIWTAIFYLIFLIICLRALYFALDIRTTKYQNQSDDIKRCNIFIALILIVIPFIPASNLLFPVGFVLAERILYTPSIGFTAMIAIGWLKIYNNFKKFKFLLNLLTIIMLIVFAFRTIERNADWSNDLTLFESGLKVNPNNAKLYNNIGHYYERLGNWSMAYKYFIQATEKDHNDIGAELNVARSLIRMNRLNEAEKLLWSIKPRVRKSILKSNRMIPQYLNIWINLAHVISLNETRLQEAENLYHEVLTIRNDFIDAYINLGELYIRKRLFDDARETYEMALIRSRHIDDNKKADLYYNLAICKSLKLDYQQQHRQQLGKKIEIILQDIAENLITAIKINHEHREAIINLSILLQRSEFPIENQLEYRMFVVESIRKHSQSEQLESFQFNLAITLLDIGGIKNRWNAITHLKRSIELKPTFRSALYNLALLYYDFKDYQQSLFYLNRTLEHHSNYTKALLLIADIYSRLGRLDETEKTYSKVLEMDHNNFEAIHHLCLIYKQQSNRRKEREKCLSLLNDGFNNNFKSIM